MAIERISEELRRERIAHARERFADLASTNFGKFTKHSVSETADTYGVFLLLTDLYERVEQLQAGVVADKAPGSLSDYERCLDHWEQLRELLNVPSIGPMGHRPPQDVVRDIIERVRGLKSFFDLKTAGLIHGD